MRSKKGRCLSCHAAVGPSPGFHSCESTPERLVELLEARLVAVVVALERGLPDVDEWNGRKTILAALAAAREQPTQDKLPLGHEYVECRRLHGRINEHACAAYNHCDECGEFVSAHQPTQDKEEPPQAQVIDLMDVLKKSLAAKFNKPEASDDPHQTLCSICRRRHGPEVIHACE